METPSPRPNRSFPMYVAHRDAGASLVMNTPPPTTIPSHLTSLTRLWQRSQTRACLTVRSGSMAPVIPTGSRVQVQFQPGLPEVGEIVVYQIGTALIIHRLMEIVNLSEGSYCICKGDANALPDPPIPADALLGIVIAIMPRKKRDWWTVLRLNRNVRWIIRRSSLRQPGR
jgi:hypothetical protein